MKLLPVKQPLPRMNRLTRLLEDVLTFFVVLLWACPVLFLIGLLVGTGEPTFYFPTSLTTDQKERWGEPPGGIAVRPAMVTIELSVGAVGLARQHAWRGGVGLLPWWLLLLVSFRSLRDVLRSLNGGRPFSDANAGRIRRVGFAILLAEAMRVALTQLLVAPLLTPRPSGATTAVYASWWPDLTMVFVGLMLLVLAEVFRRGAAMQDEQRLTV